MVTGFFAQCKFRFNHFFVFFVNKDITGYLLKKKVLFFSYWLFCFAVPFLANSATPKSIVFCLWLFCHITSRRVTITPVENNVEQRDTIMTILMSPSHIVMSSCYRWRGCYCYIYNIANCTCKRTTRTNHVWIGKKICMWFICICLLFNLTLILMGIV